jgi:hypothetical protein
MSISFDYCRYREEGDPKLIISLDWFVYEDRWSQRYMMDRPMFNDEMMERIRVNNEKRCQRLRIAFNIFHLKININIKLKHVGNAYHGRVMKDEPRHRRVTIHKVKALRKRGENA